MKRLRNLLSGINPLSLAISLSLLMLSTLIFRQGVFLYNGDTWSYLDAWQSSYSHGELDYFRTPVYPALIGIGKWLLGSNWGISPFIVQIVMFYVGGIYFSRLIRSIISNQKIAWGVIFVYFLFYPIINYLRVIGTEALSFSLVSIWAYCVWRFLQHPRLGNGIVISLVTLTSVMLRPSLLVLAVAIIGLAAAGCFIKTYRRQVLLLLITVIPTGVIFKAYTDEMVNVCGIKTISVVSVYNKYYMARQFNDIFPELLADRPDVLEMQSRYQKDGEIYEQDYIGRQWEEFIDMIDMGMMLYSELDDYAENVRRHHPDVWYGNILRTVAMSLRHQGPLKTACNDLIVLLYSILFVTAWIALRKFSLINFLTLMIGGGSLLSVFLYSYGDYGRLMLPTTPYLILMGGQILDCLRLRPFRFNLRGLYPGN